MSNSQSEQRYLENAVKLMSSLQSDDLELDDLCQILTLDTFKSILAKFTYITKLNHRATLSVIASFGFKGEVEKFQSISLDVNMPTAEAIKSNDIVWVKDKDELDTRFPLVNSTARKDYESMYVVPIRKFGSPIGAFAVVGENLPMNEIIKSDLELIALIVATRFSTKGEYLEALHPGEPGNHTLINLTDREYAIQKHMKAGLTNAQIALTLGYSESLIRQTAVSLFTKLGVSNRYDAGNLLKEEE